MCSNQRELWTGVQITREDNHEKPTMPVLSSIGGSSVVFSLLSGELCYAWLVELDDLFGHLWKRCVEMCNQHEYFTPII